MDQVFELEGDTFSREDQIRYIEGRIDGYSKGIEHHKSQIVKLDGHITMWKAILASINERHDPQVGSVHRG